MGPSFFALLVIAVSFLPVLTLEAQEGRLFKPLAYTKNLSMIVAAVLAITLDPAMRLLFTHMQQFPVSAALAGARRQRGAGRKDSLGREPSHQPDSDPALSNRSARWSLRWKWLVIAGGGAAGIRHVPDLPEAGLGVHAAARRRRAAVHADHAAGHLRDRSPAADADSGPHPDAASRKSRRVFGKAGRAETSTDPAPLSMMETTIR